MIPWQYWAFFVPALIMTPFAMGLPTFWGLSAVFACLLGVAIGSFYMGVESARSKVRP